MGCPHPPERGSRRRLIARAMFYIHLWLGVLATAILLVLAVTGFLLNHKRPLGLMPDVSSPGIEDVREVLTLNELTAAALAAVPGPAADAGIDRMDVRLDKGLVKVRFDDRTVTEVTLDLRTAEVLERGERNDVFIEKLHSGEVFGDAWVLLSDAGAVALVLLLVSGYWLWLYPRSRT
ncbi:MAG: PepSY-associated TM helix domain-containing protein [bacterium]